MNPVVVVGAGPVGLVTALLLAAEGLRVVVLERSTAAATEPRAVHLDDEALRALQRLGLDRVVRALSTPVYDYELRSASGRRLHRFPRVGEPLGHPRSVLLHQPDLEAVLRAAVRAEPLVELRLGAEVTAVRCSPCGVVVRDADGVADLAASFVLGCDGASSTVRRSLGVGWRSLGFEQTWLVVDLLVDDLPFELAVPQQRCGGARPATSVPVGRGRHRFEFKVLPGEDAGSVSADVTGLIRGMGVDPAAVDIERAAAYTFHALVARRWRSGRVFLLGDAAHLMPPFLGQGLCSGIRDAVNLAWKLALASRVGGAEALLDTYQAERRRQVSGVIWRTAALGRVVTGSGPGWDGTRFVAASVLSASRPLRRLLEGLELPPLPRGPLVQRRAVLGGGAGRPFPQAPVIVGAGELVRSDEVFGPGFALVGLGADPLVGAPEEVRRFWQALGARRIAVLDRPPRGAPVRRTGDSGSARSAAGLEGALEVGDADGRLARWFASAGADLAVVRPDRVVMALVFRGPTALTASAARLGSLVL